MGKKTARIMEISQYNGNVQARSANQKSYINLLNDMSKCYVIATGVAGSGKTMIATEKGIEFFQKKLFDKIVITRPAVTIDEEHGFLPGNLNEKMEPWVIPILDIFKEHFKKDYIEYLIKNEQIEIAPLAYIRGRTFKNAWIIADEMQNATTNQMKSLLTRLGENSKLVITGDLQQTDSVGINGLSHFLTNLKKHDADFIRTINFTTEDIQRHPAITEILTIYGDL